MSFFSAFRTPTNVEDEQKMTESQTSTGSHVDQEHIDSQVAPSEPLPELPTAVNDKDSLISSLEKKIKELKQKNKKLRHSLKYMRNQENRDIEEIDYLKLEKKYLKKRNVELSNDRTMLRNIIKTLKTIIKTQNNQLDSWINYYENSEEYRITPPSSDAEEEEHPYPEASVYLEPDVYPCDEKYYSEEDNIIPSEQEFIDGALKVDQDIDFPIDYEGAGDSA